ncbi:hypothetical protein GXM_07946 [Nostoc sphaeroides CCNUC1]|uniref:Uncharacterized protein n=1 Tax=Nostoc sphaeroides CCNUC1 TaxID=2653204 RepID=A0A5P8WD20_9NOSO|nr:hypothetical protein GXM_07946 [Nostoc sphaeroides CCNUC1]
MKLHNFNAQAIKLLKIALKVSTAGGRRQQAGGKAITIPRTHAYHSVLIFASFAIQH